MLAENSIIGLTERLYLASQTSSGYIHLCSTYSHLTLKRSRVSIKLWCLKYPLVKRDTELSYFWYQPPVRRMPKLLFFAGNQVNTVRQNTHTHTTRILSYATFLHLRINFLWRLVLQHNLPGVLGMTSSCIW